MNTKMTKHVQTLVDDDTLKKLNRLIMIEALENDTPIKGKSEWLRELIIDTLEFEPNKRKIEEFNPKIIKRIKNK